MHDKHDSVYDSMTFKKPDQAILVYNREALHAHGDTYYSSC